jgi:hypothetical protein
MEGGSALKAKLLILFLLYAGMNDAARAAENFSSGNYLLPHCKALIEGSSFTAWEGQCAGLISSLAWIGNDLPPNLRFCRPNEVTLIQQERVVVRYLEQHPEILHLDFRDLVIQAMRQAWPCAQ